MARFRVSSAIEMAGPRPLKQTICVPGPVVSRVARRNN